MKRMKRAGWVLMFGCATGVQAAVVDFNELPLPSTNTYWNGSDGSGGFTSNGQFFSNNYTDYGGGYVSWAGFGYSNVDAPNTAGWENQYAVYQPGTDRSGNGNFALGYYVAESFFGPEVKPRLTLSAPSEVQDLYINNTAYAALSVRDGDGFSAPFSDGDWFRLRIAGLDELLNPLGEIEVYMADYRAGKTFILQEWTQVNLSSFGPSVKHLEFRMDGSQVGDFGLTIPTYFALDDIQVVPEPRVALLFAGTGVFLTLSRRRRKA